MADLEALIASMTIGELAQLGDRTVSEIAAFAWSTGPTAPRGRAWSSNGAPGPSAARAVAARVGGNKYERAAAFTAKVRDVVLAAKRPMSGAEIRAKTGGNTTRLQLALKRLMADSIVTHDGGKTSARRYMAAR